ncbi:MAG: hypothetical protein LC749_21855, partial [Actinobacteria bacterium]|nr:hypothetical protein [Actinomycetota bacterium]
MIGGKGWALGTIDQRTAAALARAFAADQIGETKSHAVGGPRRSRCLYKNPLTIAPSREQSGDRRPREA